MTREFQTQLLHYFSKNNNKSNHYHQDMFCVVKRGTPPVWRWKLCDVQHRKRMSVSGINLIVWRGWSRLPNTTVAPRYFVGFLCAMTLLSDLTWQNWPIHFFPSILTLTRFVLECFNSLNEWTEFCTKI